MRATPTSGYIFSIKNSLEDPHKGKRVPFAIVKRPSPRWIVKAIKMAPTKSKVLAPLGG